MAEGHRLREARQLLAALDVYQRVLAAHPADTGAYTMRALTLADLGATQLAHEAVQRRPELFTVHDRERIEGDRIARGIAWGAARPENPSAPSAETARTLASLRALQRDTPRQTRWEATRLRLDALPALNQLRRHQEVVDGHAALLAEGVEVPAYVLPVVGDSLLALRRPDEALAVLQRAQAHDSKDMTTQLLLGYAMLESEDFERALPHFRKLAADQPAWAWVDGAKSPYANWDRYSADVTHAMARAYAGDTAGAELALAALAEGGPHNAGLQASLGEVQARRDRPRAAQQRYEMALTLDPTLREAREGMAGNWLRLARPDRASLAYDALRRETPADTRLDQLGTDIARYRGWQVAFEAGRARSETDGADSLSPLGSRDGGYALRVETPLLGERWRIGALSSDAWADFDGVRVHDRRAGLGISYRYDRLGAAAYLTRASDRYDDGGIGLDLALDWRFSDAWLGRAAYRRRDAEASLQARRLGITADSLTLGATWTPSDYTSLNLRAGRLRYEDGNDRDFASADFAQRLVSRPHWQVQGLLGAAASRASDGDETAYFNPRRDAALIAGLRAEHTAWRRYERAFQQGFEAGLGPYWQDGHGTHWIPSLAYRHTWVFGTGNRLEYALRWSRPVYDGEREQRIGFDLSYRWGTAP